MSQKLIGSILCLLLSSQAKAIPVGAHWCADDIQPATTCEAKTLTQWQEDNETFLPFYQTQFTRQNQYIVKKSQYDQNIQFVPLIAYSTSEMPAQMAIGTYQYPFITNWSHLKKIVHFGGSADEGQILPPNSGYIRTAHRNGVKVLASIFFSPDVFGGSTQHEAVKTLFLPQSGKYPSADRLVAIAKAYGFDGYFINQESSQYLNDEDYANFIKYIKQTAKKAKVDLEIEWYQVPAGFKPKLLMDGETQVSDSVFQDFGWNFPGPEAYARQYQSVGYPLAAQEFGINAANYTSGHSQKYLFDSVYPQIGTAYGSVAEYGFEVLLKPNQTDSIEQQFQNEAEFWQGKDDFKGAGQYYNEYTAIQSLPFYSFFNTGIGRNFFIKGKKLSIANWHDIGQQDYLPTERKNLEFDFADSFYGGSSIIVKNNTNLFKTNIPVTSKTKRAVLEIITKQNTEENTKLCLAVESKNRLDKTCFKLSPSKLEKWHRQQFRLAHLTNNSVIKSIDLEFDNSDDFQNNHSLKIGKIFMGHKTFKKPLPIIRKIRQKNYNEQESIISWRNNRKAEFYDIYYKGKLIGRAVSNVYVLDKSMDINLVKIKPISAYGV